MFFSLCLNYQTRHPQANFKWKENCNLTVFQFTDLHLQFAWKRFLFARQVKHLIWPQSERWRNKMLCSYFYFCTSFCKGHTTCTHAHTTRTQSSLSTFRQIKYPRWINPRQFYDDELHIAEPSVWVETYIQQMLQQTSLISQTNVRSTSTCSICSPTTWAPTKTIQERFKWRIAWLVPIFQYCQLCFCQFKGWTFQGKWSPIILCSLLILFTTETLFLLPYQDPPWAKTGGLVVRGAIL